MHAHVTISHNYRGGFVFFFCTLEPTERLTWTCLFKFLSVDQNIPSCNMSVEQDLLHHKRASPLVITKCSLSLPLSVSPLPLITFTNIQSVDEMNVVYSCEGVCTVKDKKSNNTNKLTVSTEENVATQRR